MVRNIAGDQVGHLSRNIVARLSPLMDTGSIKVEGVMKDGNCELWPIHYRFVACSDLLSVRTNRISIEDVGHTLGKDSTQAHSVLGGLRSTGLQKPGVGLSLS